MVEITELKEQIKQVARARETAQMLADEKAEEYLVWAEANLTLLTEVESAKVFQSEQEAKLREMTLAVYAETGEKKPCEGVGVRELVKLEYDTEKALSYAKEHGVALKLDTSAFEKMAKIPELRPSFVEIRTEFQATISQDLTNIPG